jgi:hypothetical protein
MRSLFATLALIGCAFVSFAQVSLRADYRPSVVINGDTLAYPWTGGFNSVVPVEMEFNGDTLMDLFLFDRAGNRITPFVNNGSTGTDAYVFAPQYLSTLPVLHDWVRSADYDCDGDLDLFTYTNSAMGVWRNDYAVGTGLQFTLVTSQIDSWYGSLQNAVFVGPVNMPALVDVDGDDDLDIITFANSSNYLEYHKNYAMDSLGICGAFRFYLQPYCWGYFKLSGLSNIGILNQNCRSGIVNEDPDQQAENNRHSGSVLTPMDQDCDGDVDLLNGDLLGQNMLYLHNGGTPDSAFIISQDSAFPVYDVQVNMQNLPGAYYLDLDNDQLKDMLVSPFATVGEDYNNIHFYKNTTDNCSNVFDFVKSRFITEETIDIGTASSVTFFDLDKDGLTDIIAGNDQYYNSNQALTFSRLAYFKNTGTLTQPAFTLITDDWLGLSAITQLALFPAFGDMDGDGDEDLLLGNADGTLIYYQNTAGPGVAGNFVFANPQYQGIDIGNNSMPQVIDVNRDGDLDILIGERAGVLNYYENTGTSTSPVYTLVTSTFGGVTVIPPGGIAGYSCPQLIDNGNGYELLVGSERGQIFHYTNIDGNLAGTFTLTDTLFQQIQELRRVTISKADIDNDGKFDLLTGCLAGGMRLYTQSVPAGQSLIAAQLNFSLYPNPTSGEVLVRLSNDAPVAMRTLNVYEITGRCLKTIQFSGTSMQLNMGEFTSGLYLLEIRSENKSIVQKIIKQ